MTPGSPAWPTGWVSLLDGQIVDDGRIARRRPGRGGAGEVIDPAMRAGARWIRADLRAQARPGRPHRGDHRRDRGRADHRRHAARGQHQPVAGPVLPDQRRAPVGPHQGQAAGRRAQGDRRRHPGGGALPHGARDAAGGGQEGARRAARRCR
ncbi:hypothetical protein [Nonomuraea dietziae]|uniref:hypothetical protein n=1 Tax=Nonomuraea dietziae TaxID=65515 RepID=UPI0031E1F3DA